MAEHERTGGDGAATVTWDRRAAVEHGGAWHSAFQMLSYCALVQEHPDDVGVVVLLGPGAATYPPVYWHERVVARAAQLRLVGAPIGPFDPDAVLGLPR